MKSGSCEGIRYGIPDVLDAVVIPGGHGMSSRCGDTLLIDTNHGVLALGDGSEKSPGASEWLLSSFARGLDECGLPAGASGDRDARFRNIAAMTEEIIRNTDPRESTTFTAFIADDDSALLLHTGDSLLCAVNTEEQGTQCIQLSRTSHLMVGRTDGLYQKEVMQLNENFMVILATDGLTDLSRSRGMSPSDFIHSLTAGRASLSLIDALLSRYREADFRLDDLGIITAFPGSMNNLPPHLRERRIITGH